MSGTVIVALIVLGIFVVILAVLALSKRSDPDTVTQEVIQQALTGPVVLPPAPHTRLGDPNRQDSGEETP